MSSSLDLKEWFNNEDAYIHIFLNNEVLLLDPKENPFVKLKQNFLDKYWLFVIKEKINPIPLNTKITYGDQNLNLGEIHNFILKIKEKWILKHKNTKNFPDILFLKRDSGSSIFIDKDLDKNHLIILDPALLLCFEDLKFTLGHELGHIDYNDQHETRPFFNLDKLQIISLTLLIISIVGMSQDFFGILRILFSISLFISYIAIFYIILSSRTYKKRIKNYRLEFYCDSYSAYLVGIVPANKISIGNSSNGFTHPSSELRRFFYSRFNEIEFYNWKSPTESHPHYFKYLSIREFIKEIKNFYSIFNL